MPLTQATLTPDDSDDHIREVPPDRAGMQDEVRKIRELLKGSNLPDQPEIGFRDTPRENEGEAEPQVQPEEAIEDEAKKGATEAAEKPATTAPKTLKALAEKLGVKAEELYALEIPFRDGTGSKTFTLGELKDAHDGKLQQFSTRELELSEKSTKHELEVARTREQLALLVKALPKNALDPAVWAEVQRQHAVYLEGEQERLMTFIPEWADNSARNKDLKDMAAHMEPYGFPASAINSMNDARLLRFVRDSMLREKRVNEAFSKAKEAKPAVPKTVASIRPAQQKQATKPPANASPRQIASQISTLLK